MKAALIFLAIVACATAAEVADPFADRSLSSAVVSAIEDMRDQMPCGFPSMGIPPLAPFKLQHFELNVNQPWLQVSGTIDNFILNGLNDFEIEEMKINAITSKVSFRFFFNNINFDTLYDLKMMVQKFGFTINLLGKGPAKFGIKGMDVRGALRYSLGLISGKLRLKSFDIRTHIDSVESDIQGIMGEGQGNQMMNNAITEAIEFAVNENEDLIANTIEEATLPVINGVLEEFTLAEIVSNIGGGGEEGEKEACIPPAF